MGKNQHIVPSFSGDTPIRILGASLLPQSLWAMGGAAVLVAAVTWFFRGSLVGKGMQAMAINPVAARLMGIKTGSMLQLAFCISAFLGAVAGILAAPITTTVFDIGLTLGLKGFVGATLGGLGSGIGSVVGGLLLGIMEAMIAGYVSPAYKDAVPFVSDHRHPAAGCRKGCSARACETAYEKPLDQRSGFDGDSAGESCHCSFPTATSSMW